MSDGENLATVTTSQLILQGVGLEKVNKRVSGFKKHEDKLRYLLPLML